MTVTNNIYQKQIKYHVFNAVANSELTELVPVFTMRPAFPTFVKKVNTSFKNVNPGLLFLLNVLSCVFISNFHPIRTLIILVQDKNTRVFEIRRTYRTNGAENHEVRQ
jgi:hypothetical protein